MSPIPLSAQLVVRCTALALAAALASPATGASAASAVSAAETCHGKAATIVGVPGERVPGTPGDDVIVAVDPYWVDSEGGDDTICVTMQVEAGGEAWITAGDGDDDIEVSGGSQHLVDVLLGPGRDVFLGGDERDTVGHDVYGTPRMFIDDVRTRGGNDVVRVGGAGGVVAGSLDLGAGDDVLEYTGGSDSNGAAYAGGAGRNHLLMYEAGEDAAWTVDNRRGRLTAGGETLLAWSGFRRFTILPGVEREHAVTFLGGPFGERLSSSLLGAAFMGAGNDVVGVDDADGLKAMSGGPGRDTFTGQFDRGKASDLRIDLTGRSGYVRTNGTLAGPFRLDFERLGVRATGGLEVVGSAADEHLSVSGCRTAVSAGAGDDVVRVLDSCSVGALLRGGAGNDRLVGTALPDRIFGGPGYDRGVGFGGRDWCDTEAKISCKGP